MFSPNGTIPEAFWPEKTGGPFDPSPILTPLADFRDRTLVLRGVDNKLKADGDRHMRGMGGLLTGAELFPGNIQGGSDTPAGWASGISIDQELKNFLQADPATRTRFGSLEFGVRVPDRADVWTRMVYAGPNRPIAPVSDSRQMFDKLFGRMKDRESLLSVLGDVRADLTRTAAALDPRDRELLDLHLGFVSEMQTQLGTDLSATDDHADHRPLPELDPDLPDGDGAIPKLSRMQIQLLVDAFARDCARVATLQYTNSVGGARCTWLGVDESHHGLSHEPDSNKEARGKLVKINTWHAGEVAHLCRSLADTPDPLTPGASLLDSTTVAWANEMGTGNSHSLEDIPWVLVGGGLGFRTGRSLKYDGVAHNRLLLAIAHGFGHTLDTFGEKAFCEGGVLEDLA